MLFLGHRRRKAGLLLWPVAADNAAMSKLRKHKRGDGKRQRSPSPKRQKTELSLLRSLWRLLGWPDLHRERRSFARISGQRNSNETITWYESGDLDDVYLIVNRRPVWCAAVYAIRFRIFSGWREFYLSADPAVREAEANRLSPWLARQSFISRESRREYRKSNPECSHWSWRRVREAGMQFRFAPGIGRTMRRPPESLAPAARAGG
jgi:hypothetical protein